jgi:cell division protein ZapA
MRAEPKTMTVRILDKEYLVACPDDERQALIDAAQHLDRAMRQIRDSGKVIGTERIAVITALNITHELLEKRHEQGALSSNVSTGITRLLSKIDIALQGDKIE